MLQGRVDKLLHDAIESGQISQFIETDEEMGIGGGIHNPRTSYGQQVTEMYRAYEGLAPGLWASPNATEIGKVDKMITLLEEISSNISHMNNREEAGVPIAGRPDID